MQVGVQRQFCRIAVAGVMMLCAGCAVGPDYRRPEIPVPAAWSKEGYDGIVIKPADMARWWEAFNDPEIGRAHV